MKTQAILGSAVVALGVATAALLAPQAASAALLDFNFSFGGIIAPGGVGTVSVSGMINGLVDNATSRPSWVYVQSAPYGFNTGTYAVCNLCTTYPGLTVANGQVTGGKFMASNYQYPILGQLYLFGGNGQSVLLSSNRLTFHSSVVVARHPTVFAPQSVPSDVPGPLTVLGAAAAFGFSRKLRKRIKGSTSNSSAVLFV